MSDAHGFLASHPSRKDKNAARVGHPDFSTEQLRTFAAQAPYAIKDRESSYGAAGEEACAEAEDQRVVVLVEPVDHANDLEGAESAEGHQRDALIRFLTPQGDGLRNEQQGVAEQANPEDYGYNLPHAYLFSRRE